MNTILQLLAALKNTSVNINGTRIQFDMYGNANIGYDVIQWVWTDSSEVDIRSVGDYSGQTLTVLKNQFVWHTGEVMSVIIMM